jgi:single-stranded-DNA-specific exonuclease
LSSAQRWCLRRRESPDAVAEISRFLIQQGASLGVQDAAWLADPVLARVLYARKIEAPQIPSFLAARGPLGDPFLMAGMARAVARLRQAMRADESIVVYGDFDADGVSATVLLLNALQQLGARVEAYIPDRFNEAYGLNKPALQRLRQGGARLVVTVDCGVRSVDEVRYAHSIGLDMIVTDHHSVPPEIPSAVAVINPKQPDCRYPFKQLSGVGVAFKLAEALFRVTRKMERRADASLDAQAYIDLVALGTVADIVPLVDENRLLVRQGLDVLRSAPRPGVAALMAQAGVRQQTTSSTDIGFRLAPRLNAAGRLKSARLAYDLLSTASEDTGRALAEELGGVNQQRQALLEKQVAEARQILGASTTQPVLVVDGPDFHEGIVGLIASRLVEEYYRPTLVMRRGPQTTRGSARSIEGFHITAALDACAHLLLRHGGHERAAGFTLPTENLEALRQHLLAFGQSHLSEEMLTSRYLVDAIVPLADLQASTPAALALLEPFGEQNPEPALATLGLRIAALRPVGEQGKHLQLQVTDGVRYVPAIAFRQGHRSAELEVGQFVDLVYRPTLNEWQGEASLQLVVQAIRPAQAVSQDVGSGPPLAGLEQRADATSLPLHS